MSEAHQSESTTPVETAPSVSKSQLVRDLIVFQFKLFIDGLRDVILIPVSFVAGILSLLKPGKDAGSEFYEVVAFGKQTERSINLFEASERMQTSSDNDQIPELDGLVSDVESYMRDQYDKGQFDGVRNRLQGLIDTIDGRVRARKPTDSDRDESSS
ncbi:MAG: hypothetical protein AAFQ99_00450 [Pseudomonadota bacterium]